MCSRFKVAVEGFLSDNPVPLLHSASANSMITEDDIKRLFPKFLRHFYLHRYDYQPGTEALQLDNVAAGGLIADGVFSFTTSDGRPFFCAFEATSMDKAGEVKYALNTWYFLWDCLAFGSVTAAVAYAIAYGIRFEWLLHLDWTGNAGFVLGMGIIGALIWSFAMRSWRKYRYIYAIEQFKQYHADEQWIALADDVFPAPNDPYLEELRNQCIYHGFGLALVSADGKVRALVAPSRLGLYGKDRRMVHWITQRSWYQAMAHNVGVLANYRPGKMPGVLTRARNKVMRPFQYLVLGRLGKTAGQAASDSREAIEAAWGRYMGSQGVQKWVFLLSCLLIGMLAYRVFTYHEVTVEEVADLSSGNPEDQYGFLYEGEGLNSRGIPKQYPDRLERQPLAPTTAPPPPKPPAPIGGEEIPTINLSGIEDEPDPVQQPCHPYRNLRGWILADNILVQKELAIKRAEVLKKAGIEAVVVPEECIGMGKGYVVMAGKASARKSEAESQASRLTRQMEEAGIYEREFRFVEVQ
ncbi:MAG: hypothetical protein NZM41_13500 [Saprospiraceae bacterium]|nr:hypothetical protein [Saprospiraceae bacterium]